MKRNRLLLWHIMETPVGPFYACQSAAGLYYAALGGSVEEFLAQIAGARTTVEQDAAALQPCFEQVREYFDRERTDFDLPLDLSDLTPFQRQVLEAVRAVPAGTTRTYGEVARLIGRPAAGRAVGGANARNPLPLIIPCHRLIGGDGALRGYGAGEGLPTKRWLLIFEGALAG